MKKKSFVKRVRLLPAIMAILALSLWSFVGQNTANEGWTLLKSEAGVEAYATELTCDGHSYIAFKVKNTNAEPKAIQLHFGMEEDPTYALLKQDLNVPGNKVVGGDCEDTRFLMVPNMNPGKGQLKQRIEFKLTIK